MYKLTRGSIVGHFDRRAAFSTSSKTFVNHVFTPVLALDPSSFCSLQPWKITYRQYSFSSKELSSRVNINKGRVAAKRTAKDEPASTTNLNPNNVPIWMRGNVPKGFWDDRANQKTYLVWLGDLLNFKTREDWYRVTLEDFEKNRGRPLLHYHYHNSPSQALSSLFSDHEFLPWLFAKASSGFFSLRANRQKYIDWLVKKCGVERAEVLRQTDFHKNHGGGLMQLYNGSPSAVLDSLKLKTEEKEGSLEFERKPKEFWGSIANQRRFLDSIGLTIGVSENDYSPWYKVDQAQLKKLGFHSGLSSSYGFSYYAMLRSVYPEYDWVPWKFKVLPRNVANEPEIIEKALGYVEKERKMTRPEDWYQVSLPVLRELGVAQIFSKLGGLYETLKQYRPKVSWDEDKFIGVRVSGERALGSYLRKFWTSPSIIHNFEIGERLKVTYYLPHLKLAFDYQGANQYSLGNETGKASLTLTEDTAKVEAATQLGIRILSIPFWWDRTLESLAATIIESGINIEGSKELERLKQRNGAAEFTPIPQSVVTNLSNWRKFVTISKE